MVGERTTIEEKVSVKRAVIGKHCCVADKVKITNSVIMDHVQVAEGYVFYTRTSSNLTENVNFLRDQII